VHPIVKPKTEIIVPANEPKINPDIMATGVANPNNKIQKTQKRKNNNVNMIKLLSL
jgi:hypothetical protein|tara:strand:+ start:39 stop:206 length:168 start_codon:yes stop_codon:yes gene_type:complete